MRLIRFITPLALLLAMLIPAGAASAAPAFTVRQGTFAFPFNLCNGEQLTLEGTFHFVLKFQQDGSIFQNSNIHAQGTSDLGNEYVLNVTDQLRISGPDQKIDDCALLVSMGSAPNQSVVLYSSNTVFTIETICRG
jgi:hypothetical protein